MLVADDVEIPCLESDGLSWLAFPSLEVTASDAPDWAGPLLGLTATHCAIAGPEQGYLILEAEEDALLENLYSPGDALAALTQRALIVTCRVNAPRHGEDIHYRYFAPQYGSPEDTATGSAMRVLAAYWQNRSPGSNLAALQCSADGGWLQSRMESTVTWIGGRVAPDTGHHTQ